jgi:hypothetical protein
MQGPNWSNNYADRREQAERRRIAWAESNGETPDIVRRKAEKRTEQRIRAEMRRIAAWEAAQEQQSLLREAAQEQQSLLVEPQLLVLQNQSYAESNVDADADHAEAHADDDHVDGHADADHAEAHADDDHVDGHADDDHADGHADDDRADGDDVVPAATPTTTTPTAKPTTTTLATTTLATMPKPKWTARPAPSVRTGQPLEPMAKKRPRRLNQGFLGSVKHVTVVSHDNSCCFADDGGTHIDVRIFRDPPSLHDGRNEEVWRKLFGSHPKEFAALCLRVKEILRSQDLDRFRLQFYCNGGKHRSVGCAEVFAGILRAFRIEVVVEHKSLYWHPRRCCDCGVCGVAPIYISDDVVRMFEQA